ncbi:MAG: YlxR family protein [Propionibacteriaceae bacterium]|nr:YlxR family protein [Propionibacteriaceae bacterium]
MSNPIRTCIGCRQPAPQDELLRIALIDADGLPKAVFDPHHRLPGRGAWLHPERPDCVQAALAAKSLTRAFRRPVDCSALHS